MAIGAFVSGIQAVPRPLPSANCTKPNVTMMGGGMHTHLNASMTFMMGGDAMNPAYNSSAPDMKTMMMMSHTKEL